MKIKHKLNPGWRPPVAVVDDKYQAEVDASMRKAERAWRQARRAASKAELMVKRKPADLDVRAEAERLRCEVEARWLELKGLRSGSLCGRYVTVEREAIVSAIWPIVEGLLSAATTEGRRQAAEAIEDHYYLRHGQYEPNSSREFFRQGLEEAARLARGGSVGQEHPQP